MFRDRELAQSEMRFDLVKQFANDLRDYCVLDWEPKSFAKILSAMSAWKKLTQTNENGTKPVKILDASGLLNF
jgi:translation initiation factor IF-3